jgi:hypothetical protein
MKPLDAAVLGALWVDLEDTCRGPLEWDLACLVANARALRLDPRPGAAALAAYGRDPADPALGPRRGPRASDRRVDRVHG